tara:strand:- start:35 stop:400 length:366 start_codon:yes stop_codon:yes gene_type:complete
MPFASATAAMLFGRNYFPNHHHPTRRTWHCSLNNKNMMLFVNFEHSQIPNSDPVTSHAPRPTQAFDYPGRPRRLTNRTGSPMMHGPMTSLAATKTMPLHNPLKTFSSTHSDYVYLVAIGKH